MILERFLLSTHVIVRDLPVVGGFNGFEFRAVYSGMSGFTATPTSVKSRIGKSATRSLRVSGPRPGIGTSPGFSRFSPARHRGIDHALDVSIEGCHVWNRWRWRVGILGILSRINRMDASAILRLRLQLGLQLR